MNAKSRMERIRRQAASVSAVVGALALQGTLPAHAATGFTYEMVRSFDTVSNNTQGEVLCSFAFNDVGQLAYLGQRWVYSTPQPSVVTSVYFWDGEDEQLIYSDTNPQSGEYYPIFSCTGNIVGLSNTGLIAINLVSIQEAELGVLYLRAGRGIVGSVALASGSTRTNLNDSEELAYFGTVSGNRVLGTTRFGSATEQFARLGDATAWVSGGPIVNDLGQAAMMAAAPQSDGYYYTGIADFDPAVNSDFAGFTPIGRMPGPLIEVCQGDRVRIYVTNRSQNTLTVLDGVTYAALATVPVGAKPFGVAVNPFRHRVYVANFDGSSISVLRDSAPTAAGRTEECEDPIHDVLEPDVVRLSGREVRVDPRKERRLQGRLGGLPRLDPEREGPRAGRGRERARRAARGGEQVVSAH